MRKTRLQVVRQRQAKALARHRHGQGVLQREEDRPRGLTSPEGLIHLQHTIGNRAVQRLLLQRQPRSDGGAKAPEAVPALVGTLVLSSGGKVEGDSRVPGHEGKIDFLSLQLGDKRFEVSNPRERESEPKRTIEIHLTKLVDKASPSLQQAAAKGTRIESAQFEFIRRTEDGAIETTATFEFKNGFITGFQMGGSEGKQIEIVSIQFELTEE
jgi:type VI secretion system Hcp family effector